MILPGYLKGVYLQAECLERKIRWLAGVIDAEPGDLRRELAEESKGSVLSLSEVAAKKEMEVQRRYAKLLEPEDFKSLFEQISNGIT